MNPDQLNLLSANHGPDALSELPVDIRVCAVCNRETRTACAKCKCAFYCSRECQTTGFKAHKKHCVPLQPWQTRLMETKFALCAGIRVFGLPVFLSSLVAKVPADQPMVDWGSGSGALARILETHGRRRVVTVDNKAKVDANWWKTTHGSGPPMFSSLVEAKKAGNDIASACLLVSWPTVECDDFITAIRNFRPQRVLGVFDLGSLTLRARGFLANFSGMVEQEDLEFIGKDDFFLYRSSASRPSGPARPARAKKDQKAKEEDARLSRAYKLSVLHKTRVSAERSFPCKPFKSNVDKMLAERQEEEEEEGEGENPQAVSIGVCFARVMTMVLLERVEE